MYNNIRGNSLAMQRSLLLFENAIKSEYTKKVYYGHLKKFLEWTMIKDFDSLLRVDEKQLQMMLEDYLFYQKKRVSPNSLRVIFGGVELFFAMNDKPLNFKKLHRMFPARVKKAGNKAWTTQDIQKMLGATTEKRNKAIVLFLASTGCRIGAITDLKLKHVIDVLDGCKMVLFYEDTEEEYRGFLTPEASKALDDYINERKQDREFVDDNSPVFRAKYRLGIQKVKSCTAISVQNIIFRLVRKAILNRERKGQRYEVPIDHGFRKRFNTILKTNDSVNLSLAEKLMGHRGVFQLDGSYLKPSDEKLFEEFKKHIQNLTVDDSERLKLEIKSKDEIIKESESDLIKKYDKRLAKAEKLILQLLHQKNPEVNPDKDRFIIE